MITLDEQISEVKRELNKRKTVYAGLIANGRLDRETAEHQTACMQAVLTTLIRVNKLAEFARS